MLMLRGAAMTTDGVAVSSNAAGAPLATLTGMTLLAGSRTTIHLAATATVAQTAGGSSRFLMTVAEVPTLATTGGHLTTVNTSARSHREVLKCTILGRRTRLDLRARRENTAAAMMVESTAAVATAVVVTVPTTAEATVAAVAVTAVVAMMADTVEARVITMAAAKAAAKAVAKVATGVNLVGSSGTAMGLANESIVMRL